MGDNSFVRRPVGCIRDYTIATSTQYYVQFTQRASVKLLQEIDVYEQSSTEIYIQYIHSIKHCQGALCCDCYVGAREAQPCAVGRRSEEDVLEVLFY